MFLRKSKTIINKLFQYICGYVKMEEETKPEDVEEEQKRINRKGKRSRRSKRD